MIQEGVQLKDFTTLQVGGPAELFTTVVSEQELLDVVKHAKEQGHTIRVIGEGSNILIPDSGLPGLTIKNAITGWSEMIDGTDVYVTIGSGESFDSAAAYTVSKEYWGLENLSYIPGTAGAAPIQNIGAYGVEIADLITKVQVFNTETEQFEILEKANCRFGYRDSIFKHADGKKYIVTSITCKLSTLHKPVLSYKDLSERFTHDSAPRVADIRNAVIDIRSKKFPDWTVVGTAGSFFKNPVVRRVTYEKLRGEFPGMPGFDVSDNDVKLPLAWVLDKVCGLKGVREGNVGTYQGQALVIVNNGEATAKEISAFAELIVQTVYEKTGIEIEWEVTRMS
ncbi:MAG: UDP-N-acetylmuramate dehydrogenase [Candidatus Azotimanducaceae bacterium]|jgi:UDP-N-acetylmuramate dehydrogenase